MRRGTRTGPVGALGPWEGRGVVRGKWGRRRARGPGHWLGSGNQHRWGRGVRWRGARRRRSRRRAHPEAAGRGSWGLCPWRPFCSSWKTAGPSGRWPDRVRGSEAWIWRGGRRWRREGWAPALRIYEVWSRQSPSHSCYNNHLALVWLLFASSEQLHDSAIFIIHIYIVTLPQNFPNDFDDALFFATRSTLKRTVFDSGRHWPANTLRQLPYNHIASCSHSPTVTTSPSSTRKAGETCAARFLCLFSYRSALQLNAKIARLSHSTHCI